MFIEFFFRMRTGGKRNATTSRIAYWRWIFHWTMISQYVFLVWLDIGKVELCFYSR